ncbi:MAG: Arc family DNA-binding protein [Acidimicrobiales bacterium]
MARSRKQFPLRVAPELYDAIEEWAGDEFRSVNAQIEAILADAVRRAGRARRPRTQDPEDGSKGASR